MAKTKLTYGFEIEGLFGKYLLNKTKSLGVYKEDGSISMDSEDCNFKVAKITVDPYCGDEECCDEHADETVNPTEFASRVFTSRTQMLNTLALFKNNYNYRDNDTCGLHLNIGHANSKFLQNVACNYKWLKTLHDDAKKNWCRCQRQRLQRDNHYYPFPKSQDELIKWLHRSPKYAFCNFHLGGYLEFRFLYPCEHKVENANKVIQAVKKLLNSQKTTVLNFGEPEPLPKTLLITDRKLSEILNKNTLKYKIKSRLEKEGYTSRQIDGIFHDWANTSLRKMAQHFCPDYSNLILNQ